MYFRFHWPPIDGNIVPSLRLLEEAQKAGLARYIGVISTPPHDAHRQGGYRTPLVANQVEFHPLLNQDVLLEAATETGIPSFVLLLRRARRSVQASDFRRNPADYDKRPLRSSCSWICRRAFRSTRCRQSPRISPPISTSWTSPCRASTWTIEALKATGYRVVDKLRALGASLGLTCKPRFYIAENRIVEET